MRDLWKDALWHQLGAAIETLGNAIEACPDELWDDRSREPEYWYLVFHTLFFLDYSFADPQEPFAPPSPFGLEELDPAGVLPPRPYSKDELRSYLEHGCRRARAAVEGLTEESAGTMLEAGSLRLSRLELVVYQTRHVQHHAAQLHLLLRQEVDSAPRWVKRAESL